MSGSTSAFTLQLLHASDLEAGLNATARAPNFAALVDVFRTQYANTLTIISGDAWIPGPFYAAEGDATVLAALRATLSATGVTGGATATAASTRASVAFMDAIGVNVATFGNHEFDGGTGPINDALGVANFPYLTADYDFSADPNLRTRVTADGQEASTIRGRIAASAVVTIDGEKIGVVGATTQLLAAISSPGAVAGKTPTKDDMPALARVLQPYIDALTAQGVNKIILSSHLQQYQLEQALAPLLSGVDIITSAGSHELFADSTDVVRPGDTVASQYPTLLKDKDGNNVLQVNEENEYAYVGRLVVQFDAQGRVLPSSVNPVVSGSYATTDAVVAQAYAGTGQTAFAAGSRAALVRTLFGAVGTVIGAKDGNLQGYTNVFLDGNRVTVRQQESNLGDLTADANLFVARQVDPTTTVSIKNGGGIRDVIGSYSTDAQSRPIPTTANPSAGKPAGAVSQLDIENSLRFNNNLSLVTITAQQLKQVMEFAATLVLPGQTPGGFVQVGGLAVSYDATRTAQVLDANGNPTTQGQRVRNLAITNDDGSIRDVIVADGLVVGNAARTIRVVTLDFIATSTGAAGTLGGDGNPIAAYATNRVDLLNNPALGAGLSTFAASGSEQDATAEYLKARFGSTGQAFNVAETDQTADRRVQNLAVRGDTVLASGAANYANLGAGFSTRAQQIFNGALGSSGFVLNAVDAGSIGAPLPGRANAIRFTPATANATSALPAGFKAAALMTAGTLVGQGSDYLLLGAATGGTLVAQTAGNATVVGGQAGTIMFGGSGATVLVGGDGNDTIVAGSGNNTVFTGGGRNVVGLGTGNTTVVSEGRGDIVIGGGGAATIGVANSALVFNNGGSTVFVGGNEASTVVGGAGSVTVDGGAGGGAFFGGAAGRNVMTSGSGAATITGGGDGDLLTAGGRAGTLLVAAASGNATLSAGGTIAANTFIAGGGRNVLAGGSGNEVFFAGRGQATITGGAGADIFAFANGRAGGPVVITDFNQAEGDRITLQGYAAGAAQQAASGAQAANGGTLVTLSDGTTITFQGVGSLTASAFI